VNKRTLMRVLFLEGHYREIENKLIIAEAISNRNGLRHKRLK
jgi:hypothetical protein